MATEMDRPQGTGPHAVRRAAELRFQGLRNERSTWDSHWKDISGLLLPRTSRFYSDQRNRGGNRNQRIIDATGTFSLQVLVAGLMAGATSPARPWFMLQSPDPELNKQPEVAAWMFLATEAMRDEMRRTNIYRGFHSTYQELGAYGTHAMFCRPLYGAPALLHFYPMTIGEYWLGQSDLNVIDTCYREFDMTVSQLVNAFGIEACSPEVRNKAHTGRRDDWVTVVHAIEPRTDRNPQYEDAGNKPWRSLYYEAKGDNRLVLSDSGFDDFPVLAPRWGVSSNDIYGNSPGMLALNAIDQLQHQQWRKGQAIDYQTQPPLQGPPSAQGRELSLLPGAYNSGSEVVGSKIEAMWRAELRLDHLKLDMDEVRERIRECFHSDLFLMLANSDRRQMTAAEVAERHEEKLLILGPVLESLHDELLRPLIRMLFKRMVDEGRLPPPPEALLGSELSVEFVSVLAQAQRQIGVNSYDRFLTTVSAIGQMKPEVWDRVDIDVVVEEYARAMGVPPKMLVPVQEADVIRKARNDAYAAKETIAAMQSQTASVKNLATSPVGGAQPNVLDALGNLTGYTNPAAAAAGA